MGINDQAFLLKHLGNNVARRGRGERKLPGIPVPLTEQEDFEVCVAASGFEQCLEAQEAERRRLAQELHDSTGHLFLELNMEIGKLRRRPGFEDAADLIDAIDEAASHIDREIRSIAFIHYPPELADRCLDDALATLARGFSRRTGLHVHFRGQCKRPSSREAAMAFLRIAQEALTNVHRHAHAKSVRMTIAEQRGRLVLRISDDGIGISEDFDPATDGGVGIRGMAHRVQCLGGHFTVHRLKRGTGVVASLPFAQLMA